MISREELSEINSRVTLIHKSLEESEKILDLAIEEDKSESPATNIVHICPQILYGLDKLQKEAKLMLVTDLLRYFEIWTYDISVAVKLNKGHLKSMKLQDHFRKCIELCKRVELILTANQ